MKTRSFVVGFCLMLMSAQASAVIHTIWAQEYFGLSGLPGDGALLTLDGAAWSVDPRVTFISRANGTFLRAFFPDGRGGLPSAVEAFSADLAGTNPPFGSGFGSIALSGPPLPPGASEEVLIEAVPEPSTLAFFVAAALTLPLLLRRASRRSRRP